MAVMELRIDIETYSSINLRKAGVYRYVNSDDFEILLFSYAWGSGEPEIIDLTDFEDIPDTIVSAIQNPLITKKAYNAVFERICLSKHLGIDGYLAPESWVCTQVTALRHGLPNSLDEVAKALGSINQKGSKGKALISFFSAPCTPTKINGGRTRNYPYHDPDRWQEYKDYNIQDVRTESDLDKTLTGNPASGFEQNLYAIDQRINDYGVAVDMQLVRNAIEFNARYKDDLMDEARSITDLGNPNSTAQLLTWINDISPEYGWTMPNMTAPAVTEALEHFKGLADTYSYPEDKARIEQVERVLEIRQQISKSSVTKYQAIQAGAILHPDGVYRVHGLLQFYGANRSGRWAGRLVQMQNLPRNSMKSLDEAREIVKMGDYDMLKMLFDNLSTVLSELIRTAFIPSPGHQLIVADYSAIEARVLAWVAHEQWRLDVFATHGKIYEASASRTFNIPMEEITKDLRQQGKVTELALGYGGGAGAIEKMDYKKAIPEDQRENIKTLWRKASPAIVQFWKDCGDAAFSAIRDGDIVVLQKGLKFFCRGDDLYITLPSGRNMVYYGAHIAEKGSRYNQDEIRYYHVQEGRWTITNTYGPKLVENITQAIARDALAVGIARLHTNGVKTVMHVHDETVNEVPIGSDIDEEYVSEVMGLPIPWAEGLLLPAEGYTTSYYKKED